MSSYQRSSLAVVFILLITFCGTFLVSEGTQNIGRIDTTEAGVYSLSEGTRNIVGRLQKPPAEVGGVGTQSPYVIVPDADAVYERAKAAGATIAYDIRDEDYGGRGFSCLDPEGHVWSFGTYDPWAA